MKLFFVTMIASLTTMWAVVVQAEIIHFSQYDLQMGMGHLQAWSKFDGQLDSCLLDTGARGTIVRSHILPQAPSLGKVPTGGISGVVVEADLIQTQKIEVDGFTRTNQVIKRADQLVSNCIIGNDFWMTRSWILDFKTKIFTDEEIFAGPTHELKNYKSWFGFPVAIADSNYDSLFDTGAAATVIDPQLVKSHPDQFEFVEKTEVTDGSGVSREGAIYRLKHIKFGDWEAKDIAVISFSLARLQVEAPSVQIVFGFNVIKNYKWYFDNLKMKWSIISPETNFTWPSHTQQ